MIPTAYADPRYAGLSLMPKFGECDVKRDDFIYLLEKDDLKFFYSPLCLPSLLFLEQEVILICSLGSLRVPLTHKSPSPAFYVTYL